MPTGTSVLGAQVVLASASQRNRWIKVGMGGALSTPPSRVGFYYVVLYSGPGNDNQTVVRVGTIYRPGQIIRLPHTWGEEQQLFRLWVDWNEAGIDWNAGEF